MPASKKADSDETLDSWINSFRRDESTSSGVPMNLLQEAWSCCCSTLQEWQELTDSFENSRHPVEKELFKNLTENFLPMLPDIFKQEEKMRRQKMYCREGVFQESLPFGVLPRRASTRIEVKQKQKEEEERRLAIEREEEKRRQAKEEYERKLAERSKTREERMREKEERAMEEERAAFQAEKKRLDRLERIEKRRKRLEDQRMNGFISEMESINEGSSQDEDFEISDSDVSVVTVNGWPFDE
jgi:hypothetical protein